MNVRLPLALTLSALLGSTAVLAPIVSYAAESGAASEATSTRPVVSNKAPGVAPSDASKADGSDTSKTGDASQAPSVAAGDATTTSGSTAPKANQEASKPTDSEMRTQRRQDREAFFSARLAALHAGLLLKPDQAALWQPVEGAIRDLAKVRAERWEMRHAELASGRAGQGAGKDHDPSAGQASDSVDRLLARGETLTKLGNAIQSLAKSTAPLLASLTPEQKNRLPALLEGLKPRRLLARAFNVGDEHEDMDDGYGYRRPHEGAHASDEKSGSDGMPNEREGGRGSMRYDTGGRGDRFQRYENSERRFREREDDGFDRAGRMNGERKSLYQGEGDDS